MLNTALSETSQVHPCILPHFHPAHIKVRFMNNTVLKGKKKKDRYKDKN